ncbi:Imm74 family immunity protein [Methylovirgula sp. 4M-Z18]|uniref:Imm74 family immunity protein n=1 Tax=Methylovirgula sp. 4M-Z18 TaxID=2293567 RepID=UPI000E2F738E|nr:Imm74 family immunity protein [Methylovirgula sp. 4M-Z18]RFB80190.1 hypothetical protein DYH55_01195 [Methylovirgula sp. 4M-Z18]
MKIEILESSVKIIAGERHLTVQLVLGDADGADVVVPLDDILVWDPPHDDEEISVEELNQICEMIELAFDAKGLEVEFE